MPAREHAGTRRNLTLAIVEPVWIAGCRVRTKDAQISQI